MKSRARGKIVFWGVLLILFFGLGSHCFAGDDLAMKWFDRFGEVVKAEAIANKSHSSFILNYHIMSLKIGQLDRGFSIFDLDRDEEIGSFFTYLNYYFFKEHSPSEEQLRKVFNGFLAQDDRSVASRIYNHLIRTAIDIGALELAKEMLDSGLKESGEEDFTLDEYERAEWLAGLYEHYSRLSMVKKADDALADMNDYLASFKIKSHLNEKGRGEVMRIRTDVICVYIDMFIRLERYTDARAYIDELQAAILKNPEDFAVGKLPMLFQYYNKMGWRREGRMFIETLLDQMIPDNNRKHSDNALPFFSQWERYGPGEDFFQLADYEYLKRKWRLARKQEDQELGVHVSNLMFDSAFFRRDFSLAIEVVKVLRTTYKDACRCVECCDYLLIGNRIWHDPAFDYETFDHVFSDPYYHIELDYEYAWYMLRRGADDKAKMYLNRALERLNACISDKFFRVQGVDYSSIIDLFWRLDDDKGLRKVHTSILTAFADIKHKRDFYTKRIQQYLLDVYLIKERFDLAEKLLEGIEDEDRKCVGYIYTGKRYFDVGEETKGEKMMEKAFSLLKNKDDEGLRTALNAFYRLFFVRPNLESPADRPDYTEFYDHHNWGSRSNSKFETW